MDGQLHSTVPEPITEPKFSYFLAEKLKLHYENFENQAVAYDEIKLLKTDNKKRGNSDRKLIFEAINQLIKYVCYDTHNTLTRISEKAHQKIGEEAIYLMFPAIIFDGLLYRASFDSGQLEIKETKHLLLNTHYRCPYCKRVESYTMDIIHSSYFPEYLNLIKKDISDSVAVLKAEKAGIIQVASNQRIELNKLQSGRVSFLK